MNKKGWKAWCVAERKLAKGVSADIASKDLPETQAWILQATAQIEKGNRAGAKELMLSAPNLELQMLLELSLSERDDFFASPFRAGLKRGGVSNKPLPKLDLMRFACAAHSSETTTRHQGLANAARTRPVLAGTLIALSRSFKAYSYDHLLSERSLRMASFWAAGLAQLMTNRSIRDYVDKYMPWANSFQEDLWPDLDESHEGQDRHSSVPTLPQFFEDPTSTPWHPAFNLKVESLGRTATASKRRELLGKLLEALAAVVDGPAPLAARPIAQAALDLAKTTQGLDNRNTLLNQLHLLEIRLAWFCEDLPHQLVDLLWSGLTEHSDAERAEAARMILRRIDPRDKLPRKAGAEILAFLVQSSANLQEEVSPLMLTHGEDVDMRVFTNGLKDVSPARRLLASGYMHAFHGSMVESCRIAALLFSQGECDDADKIALGALARFHESASHGRQERRLRQRALLELASAGAKSATPPSLALIQSFFAAVNLDCDKPKEHKALLAAIRPAFAKRISLPAKEDRSDELLRLQLNTLMGERGQTLVAFTKFGRWLRSAPKSMSIPAALKLCADICLDGELTESLVLDGTASPSDDDPRSAWLHSTTAWLDHQDYESVGKQALVIAQGDSDLAQRLIIWHRMVSDLQTSEAWEDVEDIAEEDEVDEFPELLADFLDGFDLSLEY